MDFRHEWKHEITMADLLTIRQRMKAVAKLDEHAGNGSYFFGSVEEYLASPYGKRFGGVR